MIPDPRFAAFLKALDETQYLPPDRLRAYQRRLLTKLIEHARSETDFYADRLAPIIRADGTIDWNRIEPGALMAFIWAPGYPEKFR